ncbi:sulfoxide reductase heme-binding subunit YedZ [Acetobacter sp. TBRC 12305]|uniref:Sulfoxide reductase heme-binding subunit YedZ n=1 Tax=Acetobacter garciniae TaxID=2817435 RepID=A0A939KQW9_9PROT|nr:protein-methionine-sulfoxide reductase heme-binding subunit MsrQ [Acetobacter garciniae]MBO1325947.1 sulfoxide reductase heme-binding subunit YedZ [Acetobacter garciniae]MBX0345847.1 sulfoxide reductase heme-binding subunit YedZ [Acetobacter garciniae]
MEHRNTQDRAQAGRPRRRSRFSPFMRQLLFYLLFMVPAVTDVAALWLGWAGAMSWQQTLHEFGRYAFRFLLASLLVSPLRRFFKLNFMVYRRPLGLLAFSYALLHVAIYVCGAARLDLMRIVHDFLTRPFLICGALALLCMMTLALTSTRTAIMQLGRKWTELHRLAYMAMVLVCLHYSLAFKTWRIEPLLYAAFALAVLATRLFKPGRGEQTGGDPTGAAHARGKSGGKAGGDKSSRA